MHDHRAFFQQPLPRLLNEIDETLHAALCHVYVPQDTIIHRQGEPIERVFVLCEGSAQWIRHTPLGQPRLVIPLVEPGTVLGCQELLTGQTCWDGTVEALESCQLVEMDVEAFWYCLERFPAFSLAVLHQSLQRERELQHRLVLHLSRAAGTGLPAWFSRSR